ncbi:hypothetical protein CLV53_1161 [Sediminibacterium magnilacihabitans]|nr:hypothetical protein CLV53_1161 [Sediminibacterium magnilacihabitans]
MIYPAGSECVTKKIKAGLIVSFTVLTFGAIHNLCFARIKFQLTFSKPLRDSLFKEFSLLYTYTVYNNVIAVSFKLDVRKILFHPFVKSEVRKDIRTYLKSRYLKNKLVERIVLSRNDVKWNSQMNNGLCLLIS